MSSTSFGRRAPQPQPVSPRAAPAPQAIEPDDETAYRLAGVPMLTTGLAISVIAIFVFQTRHAVDVGPGGNLNGLELIAFGGVSYDLVFGAGEYWRIFLASVLHLSWSHVIGNCVALGILGFFLERVVGQGWYAGIYAVSGLTGVAGSLLGNPHALTSGGASGAITGLLAAVFVLSFHDNCDAKAKQAMRKYALRFGLMAFGGLVTGSSSHVDYNAHLGGALGGGLVAFFILALWDGKRLLPTHGWIGGVFGLAVLALTGISATYAAEAFPTHEAKAGQYAPSAKILSAAKGDTQLGVELGDRYRNDLRARYLSGVAHVKNDERLQAEEEFRAVMALAAAPEAQPLYLNAEAQLAVLLAMRGQRGEAGAMAEEVCGAPQGAKLKPLLKKARLCD